MSVRVALLHAPLHAPRVHAKGACMCLIASVQLCTRAAGKVTCCPQLHVYNSHAAKVFPPPAPYVAVGQLAASFKWSNSVPSTCMHACLSQGGSGCF